LSFCTLFAASIVLADSWALPEKKTICSKNKKYCLKVIPKKLTSQLDYFQDKVGGKENAGADKKVKKNLCRGIFSVREGGSLRKKWEINLANEVSPVSVLVSDEGDYVVTFDNWHSVGYGDDVVAIYQAGTGALVRKFGLSEFLTESDIDQLPASVSSIWWGGQHYIDYMADQLILQVVERPRGDEKEAKYFPVRVDLSNGRVLDEKKDRLASLRYVLEADPADEPKPDARILSPSAKECLEGGKALFLKPTKLLERLVSRQIPEYPPAARAVRAVGQVLIAMRVQPDGTVGCSEPITGHPLLRVTLSSAVKKWKFRPSNEAFSGLLMFTGKEALVNPDGSIVKVP